MLPFGSSEAEQIALALTAGEWINIGRLWRVIVGGDIPPISGPPFSAIIRGH